MSRPLFGFLCCIGFEGQTFCCCILICFICINDVAPSLLSAKRTKISWRIQTSTTAGTKHCKMAEHWRALAKASCQRLTNVGFRRWINVMNYITSASCLVHFDLCLTNLLLCLLHFDLCLTNLLLCLVHFDLCLTNLLLCLLNLNFC